MEEKKNRNFENLLVWQKARELTVMVYKQFRLCKDFSFRDQVQRAAVSVMNNIAEGYERYGKKELSHYLYISKGSCGEVRSMMFLANDLEYVSKNNAKMITDRSEEISRMLNGFIKSLKS